MAEDEESEFHVGLRVRKAVVDGVNATTAVDVAIIIKMAGNLKRMFWREVRYLFACIFVICLI